MCDIQIETETETELKTGITEKIQNERINHDISILVRIQHLLKGLYYQNTEDIQHVMQHLTIYIKNTCHHQYIWDDIEYSIDRIKVIQYCKHCYMEP